ncbi:MAG: FAD:protein FMN transferase [Cyclobacteriaceae bacterium]|nr:MAG: FAD:protein FMN transferase [Cyclobacteriaceae bacterium]
MSPRARNLIYSFILLVAILAVYYYRRHQQAPVKIEGPTMGTTYHITYFDKQKRNFKPQVDSLLRKINESINTYLDDSEVTLFNRSASSIRFRLPYLREILERSQPVVTESEGAFDPTVMPLVNAWGFGPAQPLQARIPDVDSLRTFVGFEKIGFNADSVWKTDPRTQLDFGGIGQGYGADVIARFLKQQGITDMLVEIGGEGLACGINRQTGKPWQIGILDPNSTPNNLFFKAYVSVTNESFTTSGGYFNYREIQGRKFSHTIDPKSGYPVNNPLLSVSVFTKDATSADGWATALMVMGPEKARSFLEARPGMQGILMYTTEKGNMEVYITPGLSGRVKLNQQAP